MSTPDSNAVAGPNRDLIAGLRECADWLEQHPGLPPFNAHVGTYPHGKQARVELTALASALGDRAQERCLADRVSIEGKFGPVTVGGSASLSSLGARPQPRYVPIIGAGDDVGRRRGYEVVR